MEQSVRDSNYTLRAWQMFVRGNILHYTKRAKNKTRISQWRLLFRSKYQTPDYRNNLKFIFYCRFFEWLWHLNTDCQIKYEFQPRYETWVQSYVKNAFCFAKFWMQVKFPFFFCLFTKLPQLNVKLAKFCFVIFVDNFFVREN